jgi:hypothetical protein
MVKVWFKLYVAFFRLAMWIAENKIDVPPIEYVAGHTRYIGCTIRWSTENGKWEQVWYVVKKNAGSLLDGVEHKKFPVAKGDA